MKTIKQIADDIGVSKQAVFYRINKPPLSEALAPFISTIDGALQVELDGENLIKQDFRKNRESSVDAKETPSVIKAFDGFDAELIKILRETSDFLRSQLEAKDQQLDVKDQQLEAKDEQIKEMQKYYAEQMTAKDRHISELTVALENITTNLQAAQALHAGTIQKQLTENKPAGDEELNLNNDKQLRRRWWAFWSKS